jgi:hypothetical protein
VPETLPDVPPPVTVPDTLPVVPLPVVVPPNPPVNVPVTCAAFATEVPRIASAAIIAALAIEFLMLCAMREDKGY